jgi:glutamate/tyrosine decarboxylase-like PLP-dependent enzyme
MCRRGLKEAGVLKAEFEAPLDAAVVEAKRWLASLDQQPVGPEADARMMLRAFNEELPAKGEPADLVVRLLAQRAAPGLFATGSGRFHGWVVGGALPAAVAADWMVSAWDQNAGMAETAPAVCAVEQVVARWVLELLGLAPTCSVGFVTGGQMANTVCLAAARNYVLAAHGWDVEADGLIGAPPVTVVVGDERHSTIDRGLRLLGFGSRSVRTVEVDGAGRINPGDLESVLAGVSGPTIVCVQAGNVNGGAVDPFGPICDVIDQRDTDDIWLHADGAFGLWVRAEPTRRHLLDDVERADSWATDAHKWLNTPYDCGMAICARPESQRRAMGIRAAYLPSGDDDEVRNPVDFNPEFSRRARAVPVWAALRQLGADGLARIVDRCCLMAERYASALGAIEGVEVMHQDLNQVVIRFDGPSGGHDDEHTRQVISKVQAHGTCYPSATVWHGAAAMRISVCNWRIDEEDVDRSVASIMAAHSGL